ncbi:MAG: HAD-IIIC family phosphatase, partial [Caulobacteraceae bacterium]
MPLRRSRFVHLLPLGPDKHLLIHAVSHVRLLVNDEIAALIDHFSGPKGAAGDDPALAGRFGYEPDTLAGCVAALKERGALTELDAEAEEAETAARLGESYGRDPGELLDRFRREAKEGGEGYWASGEAATPTNLGADLPRLDVVLMGDCDVHMEAEFLRREAAARGYDLRVAATFPDDARFAGEHRNDAVLIGALRARHALTEPFAGEGAPAPHEAYLTEARRTLLALREHTAAPILVDNLPEPTVQPLGLAERGVLGHRNRFRLANLALADLAEGVADAHVVDAAAALAAAGAERMLDDGQVGFTHLGSPGWMLQRPAREKAAVHELFPDLSPLARLTGGDPYGREKIMAKAHFDALATVLGLDRKKCVIVDLDGVLWPGVLAETGAPFAWTPEVSGPFSYVGLYFGLHEALLCLKRRGVLLAAVSKNDEATVRELWRYPDHYPKERLLTPDDFVTWRVNWNDKVENIGAIADELGFAPSAFLFIDDHPVERDRVRQRLPEVEVWGEDPFELRRRLLADPR